MFAISSPVARQQVHPVLRDLLVTAAASFATFVAGLVLISMFGRLLGATLLAEYLLLKRVAAWLQPLAHFGLGVAVPRYVAYSTQESPASRLGYFVAGTICIAFFGSILGITLRLARRPLGQVLFGDAELSRLMLPLFLLLLAGAVQVAVYGFYRGCLDMKRAGAITLCTAIAPIVSAVALFRSRSVVFIVSAMACSVIAVAAVFAIPILRDLHRHEVRNIRKRAGELLKYGVSRVPGDLGNGALLAVGPVIALHYTPVERVSYLLVAISLLTAASVSTEPLGLVFLSKISMMVAQDRLSDVRTCLLYLMSSIVDLSIFLTVQLGLFVDVLLQAWIGPSFLQGIAIIRLVMIGIPFYLFYTALRSPVDAGSIRPLNARNIVVSLMALLIMIALGTLVVPREFLLHAIAISLVLAFALLAYATRLSLTKLYDVQVHWKESAIPIVCALVLGVLGLAYHKISHGSLLQLAALELIFTLAFLGVCFYSKVRWVRLLSMMLFRPVSTQETVSELVLP